MEPSAGLQALLGEGVDVETFFKEYHEKKPLHVQRGERGESFYREVFSIWDVESVCRRCHPDEIMMKQDGIALRQEECSTVFQGYLHGGSVILNHADAYHPPMARLCAALRENFIHCYANLYLTPPQSQAVKPHSDDQDVIIIQIYGSKTWMVYPAVQELNYTDEMVGKGKHEVTQACLDAPLMTDEKLEAGDLLYLPRGFVHEARCSDEPSLHMTITVPSHDFTWAQFATRAIERSLRSHVSTRHAVPAAALRGELDESTEERFRSVLSLIGDVDFQSAKAEFAERIKGHNDRQDLTIDEEHGPLPGQLGPDIPIRMAPEMDMKVNKEDRENPFIEVKHIPQNRTLRIGIRSDHVLIFQAIARTGHDMFRLVDLPGDGFSQACVCKLLISKDVLQVGSPKKVKKKKDPKEQEQLVGSGNPEQVAQQGKVPNPEAPEVETEKSEAKPAADSPTTKKKKSKKKK